MALKVKTTGDSSFCPGVARAFTITKETLFDHRDSTFSLGPLIHNPEVVALLEALGLSTIDPGAGDLPELKGSHVIIRSHGTDMATEKELERRGAVLVDATCPTVKRVHEAARELMDAGYDIVILGRAEHPEVQAIVGRVDGPVTVLESTEDAIRWASENDARDRRVGLVCQTTISRQFLDSVTSVLRERVGELEVRDTICEAVLRRREEALELAGEVDLLLVVGGRMSSNTAQLAMLCASTGVRTYLIERPAEIQREWLEGVGSVGVIGGASTPRWVINHTTSTLRKLDRVRGMGRTGRTGEGTGQ
jgi:4-hydroxy-3-methylbut-2-enyl diphosphate reductase